MKIVQQTIASLGSPMWIEPLEQPYGSTAVIARWRHLNGRLRISTADANPRVPESEHGATGTSRRA